MNIFDCIIFVYHTVVDVSDDFLFFTVYVIALVLRIALVGVFFTLYSRGGAFESMASHGINGGRRGFT